MNARAVSAAAGVVHAAMKTHSTAAGIAMAVEAAGLLMSPEVAAELARLRAGAVPLPDDRFAEVRARAEAATEGPWCTDGWEIYTGTEYLPWASTWIGETCRASDTEGACADAAFIAAARSDVPVLLAEVDRLRAERHSTNEELSSAVERVAELEKQLAAAVESPLAWADDLDAKSLDNFLITLGQATEYEPLNGAISYIHELLTSFRVAVAARGGEHRG